MKLPKRKPNRLSAFGYMSRLYIFYKNVKQFGGGHETPTLTERSEVGQFARRLKISTTPKSL